MKKSIKTSIICLCFFVPVLNIAGQSLSTAISPSTGCSLANTNFTVMAQVTNTSPCAPIGSGSYTWVVNPANATIMPVAGGTSAVISFSTCGVYSITCFGYAPNIPVPCDNTMRVFTITCAPAYTVNVTNSAVNTSICAGTTATLTASGANNYTWSTGATGNSVIVTPSVSSCYSVVGTGTTSCFGTASSCINVVNLSSLSISGNTLICAGSGSSLTASGAANYSWSNGANTATTIVNPVNNAVYTVTGSIGSCSATKTIGITINPTPVVSVSGQSIICTGESTTLTAFGALTYTWSNGFNTTTIAVSPTSTTIYSVTGTNFGCNATKIVTVMVNPKPLVTVLGQSIICAGQTTTLTGSGALTYTWSNAFVGANSIVSPSVTTNYTVTGTDANGCQASATFSLQVSACASLREKDNSNLFSVFPNPTQGLVRLHAFTNDDILYRVYDLTGREILQGNFNGTKTLDISKCETGAYVIRFDSGSVTSYKKLILEK